jgi:hypothetical protein
MRNDNKITDWRSRNNFRLSAMYTMGASEFHANVGHANKWSNITTPPLLSGLWATTTT